MLVQRCGQERSTTVQPTCVLNRTDAVCAGEIQLEDVTATLQPKWNIQEPPVEQPLVRQLPIHLHATPVFRQSPKQGISA